ncbi:unnamed protein product [Strongylus vulgaris]|uniref:Uncharacterized protein n=1 Tax=Strongylus vulgaris TaxID=40348 RepID=A0A3P7HZF0_STRVU|nr:unnamed protein product [Strongylus vulgaris]
MLNEMQPALLFSLSVVVVNVEVATEVSEVEVCPADVILVESVANFLGFEGAAVLVVVLMEAIAAFLESERTAGFVVRLGDLIAFFIEFEGPVVSFGDEFAFGFGIAEEIVG